MGNLRKLLSKDPIVWSVFMGTFPRRRALGRMRTGHSDTGRCGRWRRLHLLPIGLRQLQQLLHWDFEDFEGPKWARDVGNCWKFGGSLPVLPANHSKFKPIFSRPGARLIPTPSTGLLGKAMWDAESLKLCNLDQPSNG